MNKEEVQKIIDENVTAVFIDNKDGSYTKCIVEAKEIYSILNTDENGNILGSVGLYITPTEEILVTSNYYKK